MNFGFFDYWIILGCEEGRKGAAYMCDVSGCEGWIVCESCWYGRELIRVLVCGGGQGCLSREASKCAAQAWSCWPKFAG